MSATIETGLDPQDQKLLDELNRTVDQAVDRAPAVLERHQTIGDRALAACEAHHEGAVVIHDAFEQWCEKIKIDRGKLKTAKRQWRNTMLFAIVGHGLIQVQAERLLELYLPIPYPVNQLVLAIVLLGVLLLTSAPASATSVATSDEPPPPWFADLRNLPGAIYALVLLAMVGVSASAVGSVGIGLAISAIGLGMAGMAWIRSITLGRQIHELIHRIEERENRFHRDEKLDRMAAKVERAYEFDEKTIAAIKRELKHGRPVEALVWAFKVALALMVAYPGHIAMGELIGFSSDYSLGFKVYWSAWPVVTALLMVAEVLIGSAVVRGKFVKDATNYHAKGYPAPHYRMHYHYRRRDANKDEIFTKRLFYGIAAICCLADFGFNVYYLWDMIGNMALAVMAGAFFTSLLVGMAVLLGNGYDYKHAQHKATSNLGAVSRGLIKQAPLSPPPAQPTAPPPPPVTAWHHRVVPAAPAAAIALTPGAQTLSVGARPDCAVSLDQARAQGVSRQHAELRWDGATWWLTDVGSSYGTFVDGVPLPARQPQALQPGSRVRFGQLEVTIE